MEGTGRSLENPGFMQVMGEILRGERRSGWVDVGEEVVIEGMGTDEEMEARLITELKHRGWLNELVVAYDVAYDQRPPQDGPGNYRVRITPPKGMLL